MEGGRGKERERGRDTETDQTATDGHRSETDGQISNSKMEREIKMDSGDRVRQRGR
jgi:hypothetical protein